MGFQLSPSVIVTEKDLTNVVPAVSTSIGAFAGAFSWGPVLDPFQITNENELVASFGRPGVDNGPSWFTAADFLAYSRNLWVCRADTIGQANATAEALDDIDATDMAADVIYTITTVGSTDFTDYGASANTVGVVFKATGAGTGSGTVTPVFKINNATHYDENYAEGGNNVGSWAARFPGTLGNSITVAIADSNCFAEGTEAINSDDDLLVVGQRYMIVTPTVATDWSDVGGPVSGLPGDIFTATDTDSAVNGTVVAAEWEYASEFDSTPGTSSYAAAIGGSNDEVHVIVIDSLGRWTGIPGTILERFAFLSKASDAKKGDGTLIFFKDYINNNSKYIYWMDHPSNLGSTGSNWGLAAEGTTFKSLLSSEPTALSGGANDLAASVGALTEAWEIFSDVERFDISLLPTGAVNPYVANYIIQNVGEVRKDCVVFISPTKFAGNNDPDTLIGDGVMISGSNLLNDTLKFRNGDSDIQWAGITSSSYAVCDSGWKKRYDQYNDTYRWVPLNGDIAGICARTDETNDPWYSPAGLNRGQLKNVSKLAFSPNLSQRDELYKVGINPVVSFKGQGTILFGDKTLLAKPSAFDRINVRRLFIVMEKAIATAAKFQLFEFNDSFTRSQFRSMTEPFLRDVQGRRGIYDYRVVCDESNNTGEVIDRNEFVGDIYIKPARSINFIRLNFIAARTGISFEEVGA